MHVFYFKEHKIMHEHFQHTQLCLANNKQAQKSLEMETMRNVMVSGCSAFAWKRTSAAAIPEDKTSERFASAYCSAGGFAQQTGHKD